MDTVPPGDPLPACEPGPPLLPFAQPDTVLYTTPQ